MIERMTGVIAALFLPLALAANAAGDLHQDQVDQTGWSYLTNVDADRVGELLDEGNRLVDLEIEQADPLRFNVVAVPNIGAYASGWWWYYDATAADVDMLLEKHDGRLVDLEPYQSPSGQRYAIVMKPASGNDAVSETDWVAGLTFNGVVDWVDDHPGRRIHDIVPYETSSGAVRYAFTWVSNTGSEGTGWWYYLNTTAEFIEDRLEEHGARLVDLERHPNGNWSALMVPGDGNQWWWFYDVPVLGAFDLAASFGGRVVDLERYPTPSGDRLAIVVRRNANDLTLAATAEIRNDIGNVALSGLYCTEIDGPFVAGTNTFRTFEPASLLKTYHHFAAMRFISTGGDDLEAPVSYLVPENYFDDQGDLDEGKNRCPEEADGTWSLTTAPLGTVLRRMMENSSNPATEAIRARYGTGTIEAIAAVSGADSTDLNHTLGCGSPGVCDGNRNETTLRDLAAIHRDVADGILGAFEDEFHDAMVNFWTFQTVLQQELGASSLGQEDQDEFRDRSLAAVKGGSYGCSTAQHRSRGGYFRVPERREDCSVVDVEYFAGAWINDAPASLGGQASANIAATMAVLYRDRIRAAIDTWSTNPCEACPGDFNGDGLVDGADMGQLLTQWGPCPRSCTADLDGDGDVDGGDLGIFLSNWGACL